MPTDSPDSPRRRPPTPDPSDRPGHPWAASIVLVVGVVVLIVALSLGSTLR